MKLKKIVEKLEKNKTSSEDIIKILKENFGDFDISGNINNNVSIIGNSIEIKYKNSIIKIDI